MRTPYVPYISPHLLHVPPQERLRAYAAQQGERAKDKARAEAEKAAQAEARAAERRAQERALTLTLSSS